MSFESHPVTSAVHLFKVFICIYIPLAELQEPVDSRKQPLPNQFAGLKVSGEKQR